MFTDSEIPLRLANGSSCCAGRVEVLHDQQWGTVCDDDWDLTDAGVVCRQLGCGTVLSAPGAAQFGQGSERIWLDDINCKGTEAALSECTARPWGDNNCNHGEDASAVCSDSTPLSEIPLRLVNGPSHCAGRIEVLHDQQWGTVCDDDWDLIDAGVVCRQLGCGTALSAPGVAQFGQGSGCIWLDDVNCTGTEAALSECTARPWGDSNCNHGEDASAVCSGTLPAPTLLLNQTSARLGDSVRLQCSVFSWARATRVVFYKDGEEVSSQTGLEEKLTYDYDHVVTSNNSSGSYACGYEIKGSDSRVTRSQLSSAQFLSVTGPAMSPAVWATRCTLVLLLLVSGPVITFVLEKRGLPQPAGLEETRGGSVGISGGRGQWGFEQEEWERGGRGRYPVPIDRL
ncbi:scavenger receptor cysteine-rich domain-containing group B protein-like [Pelodiscus sinensis]|uniref:scavenger receptor cysteine-rich domain-containing group B protein-like n=1 Tax=Pelodiscus sinensis TaxID=13735 RepID=UPI003F6C3809